MIDSQFLHILLSEVLGSCFCVLLMKCELMISYMRDTKLTDKRVLCRDWFGIMTVDIIHGTHLLSVLTMNLPTLYRRSTIIPTYSIYRSLYCALEPACNNIQLAPFVFCDIVSQNGAETGRLGGKPADKISPQPMNPVLDALCLARKYTKNICCNVNTQTYLADLLIVKIGPAKNCLRYP